MADLNKDETLGSISEPWDETLANELLKEYTNVVTGLPSGTITWAGDVDLYPDKEEGAIDEAANRQDLPALRAAVGTFRNAASCMVEEKKRIQSVMRLALTGTLRGNHRLPVRKGQREWLGRVLLIVETQAQAEVLAVHGFPDTTTFYREEFADFLRSLQAGKDVAVWMEAKRKFKGVTVPGMEKTEG